MISCTLRVMNRSVKLSLLINLGSVWHLLMIRISIISVIFFAKREIRFEVSTFGGSLFSGASLLSGFDNTCDTFSPLSEVRYFRRIVTFGTLRHIFGYFLSQKTYFRGIRTLFVKWKWSFTLFVTGLFYFYITRRTRATRLSDPTREIADFVIQYGHTQCFLQTS